MITSYEPNDDTLKKFLGTNSIIPPDLTKVNQFTASNVVLYNNNQIIYKGITVNVSYNDFNRQMTVRVEADVQFKFFVYYTTEITKTPVVEKVKSSFAQKASQNRQKVVTVESKVKEHHQRIKELKDENKEKLDRQAILKTNITSLSTEIATLTKTIKDGHKELEKELNDEIASVQSIQKDELYLVGDKIIKIFQKNLLKSNIQEQFFAIDKFVEEESAKIKTWRDNFTASLDEVLNSEEESSS